MVNYITFPGLFDDILTVPTDAFFGIKWYAIIIMSGFLIAAIYAMVRAKEFGVTSDDIADVLIFGLPAAVIGARLYFVLNSWEYYSQNLNKIVAVWEGGLAIYGAVIAGIITVIVVGKVKKFDILSLMDLGAIGLLIGQCIGRWGNFFNAEAFGSATTLPWGMVIRNSIMSTGTPVHPTFLYESLWTLLGFLVLHLYSKRRKFKGELFLMYVAWYGLGRGFIEGLRTDSLYLGATDIRVSQVLAFGSCIAAVGVLIYLYVSKKYVPAVYSEPVLAGDTLTQGDEPVSVQVDEPVIEPNTEPAIEPNTEPSGAEYCDCTGHVEVMGDTTDACTCQCTEEAIVRTQEEMELEKETPKEVENETY